MPKTVGVWPSASVSACAVRRLADRLSKAIFTPALPWQPAVPAAIVSSAAVNPRWSAVLVIVVPHPGHRPSLQYSLVIYLTFNTVSNIRRSGSDIHVPASGHYLGVVQGGDHRHAAHDVAGQRGGEIGSELSPGDRV